MDCLFNKIFIPNSSSEKIIIKAKGKTFINGLSKFYCDEFPKELINYIDYDTFKIIITDINDYISAYWPCLPIMVFGYLCCPCTLGLSFLAPFMCINDGEQVLKNEILRINNTYLIEKGLKMNYRKKCSTSWLEFEIFSKYNKSLLIENDIKKPLFSNELMKF